MPRPFDAGFDEGFGPFVGGERVGRHYRIRVSKRGSTDLGSTNVAFTISTTGGSSSGFIQKLDRWGGQEIRPTDGKTVSRSWTVTLGESQDGVELTPKLMDEGRAAILHRLLDVSSRPTTDAAWSSTHIRATGRISDVQVSSDVGSYELTVQDERFVERRATIFTDAIANPNNPDPTDTSETSIIKGSTTFSLFPRGLTVQWGAYRAREPAVYGVSAFSTGNLARLFFKADATNSRLLAFSAEGKQLILDDLNTVRGYTVDTVPEMDPENPIQPNSTRGDFRTLVAEVNGTNRRVRAPGLIRDGRILTGEFSDLPVPDGFWIVWPSSERPASGTEVDVRFKMPTHAPSPGLPKHIAGGTSDAPGEHMVQVGQDIWDELGVRYSSTQVTAMKNRRESRRGAFVIAGSNQNAAEWMQERLWKHAMIAPVVDEQGRVAPKSIALPTGEDIISLSNVQTAGSSNVSSHPTWSHPSNELINVLNVTARRFRQDGELGDPFPIGVDTQFVVDEFTVEHETAKSTSAKFLGRNAIDLKLPAFSNTEDLDFVKTQFFTRYGDGPVRSEVSGMSGLESVKVGEFVVMDVPTYPNLGSSGRGGQRLLQVVSRTGTLSGPRLSFMDAGTTASKLSTPTLSLSRSTVTPRHAIDVAVSTTGSGYVLQHAESDASVGRASSLWQTAGGNFGGGSTYTVSQLSAGGRHHFRAAARGPGRIGSTWSSPASTTTQGLTKPVTRSANVTACSADLLINPSMSDYPMEVTYRNSSQVFVLPSASSGSTVLYEARDLSASSTFVLDTRHIDGFGGESDRAAETINTTTAAESASPVDFSFVSAAGTT